MVDQHKAIILAETHIVNRGYKEFLKALDINDWHTDTGNDEAILLEIAGRLCYKSFNTELNPNITRVREGNEQYIGNIMAQKHGSVFEHASTTVALLNVSRVLTHELVRHRPGVGFSQESQRFVRLDDFEVYIPNLTDPLTQLASLRPFDTTNDGPSNSEWVQEAQDDFMDAIEDVKHAAQVNLANLIEKWGLDADGVPFHIKKGITSALRRFIPGGVNTNIIVTTNHRMWRHMIENRTAPGAEQEIVEVFGDIARMFGDRYPEIYQDMIEYRVDGDTNMHYRFKNQKI